MVALFVTTGGLISTHIGFERSANIAVEETLEQDQYGNLELVKVQAGFNVEPFFVQPTGVTVTVPRPTDQQHPTLGSHSRQRIIARTDRTPIVRVEFVESQRAPSA